MCVVSVMKSFIEGLVELAYFALLYDHLVASVMKLAISVIESAFRLHSDSVILSAVSVMIFVNFGSTNNLFPMLSMVIFLSYVTGVAPGVWKVTRS